MKIGILGGTFNPIHYGHLILAEQVRDAVGLKKVVFVPANLAPHKDTRGIISARQRLDMVRLAIKSNPGFSVSDMEIKRGGKSYTVETLRQFRRMHPKDELFFITGSDLIRYLDEWKDISEVFRMANFVAATRPGYLFDNLPGKIVKVRIRSIDISAFEIRDFVRKGRSIRYLVPDSVQAYIKKNRLYR